MNKAIDNLLEAQKFAFSNRPTTNGFPFLAEVLRQAGVRKYFYSLPSCQCIYLTKLGNIVQAGQALIAGNTDVPPFHKENFLQTLRASQSGKITFPEFLKGSWNAGVVNYDVDLEKRIVSYYGVLGESYIEEYPAVEVNKK